MKNERTCVSPEGCFIVGVHRPAFEVRNFRQHNYIDSLGQLTDGSEVKNNINFPDDDLAEPGADIIYEVANPFPFRGTTFINTAWADAKARAPESIRIKAPGDCSFLKNIASFCEKLNFIPDNKTGGQLIDILPRPLLLALAQASTDPEELVILAEKSCRILHDSKTLSPIGIGYKKESTGKIVPDIFDSDLFEVLVNNIHLPDAYKNTLVLKPGVQGHNEITGEYTSGSTHVFEYLRRNSYIPWGHFAANMANDAIRYRAKDLCEKDMTGIRHLYYQRVYARLARQLELPLPQKRQPLSTQALERLRLRIREALAAHPDMDLEFNGSLWGWNYGFGFAQSGQRLHASHQMIHQQNAMIPKTVLTPSGEQLASFACGDMVKEFITRYQDAYGCSFFSAYIKAIKNNTRIDGCKTKPSGLIVFEDNNVILFVPKAQISEWELQLMPRTPAGNILEADSNMRKSLDRAILYALKILDTMGARMVTSIEISKRFDDLKTDQHLLYSFIPRLPYAPGTFSEAQNRWISGCYPEDVAWQCKKTLQDLIKKGI